VSWYEFKHALRDWRRGSGWYGTYPYAQKWRWLQRIEWWLRARSCARHGHNFPGGANGEHAAWTWKHFCVTCQEPAPYEWEGKP
jgi:hypothetical protein